MAVFNLYSYCVLVTESHFSPPRAPTLAGTTAADTPQRCEGAGLQGSPRGPNLADVQDREMSTFPGEYRGTPAVQSRWGITRASAGARGERRERDAAPERARGPKQASGMCLARRARIRSNARAARAAPSSARLSSLGRRLGRESGPGEHQGRSTGASKRAMAL